MAPVLKNTTERTKKEKRIEENWPIYGLLSFIKKEGRKILSSGAIVEFRSPYFPDCTRCLLISDKFFVPDAYGSIHDYCFVLLKMNGSLKTVELSYVAKPKTTKLFRPTPGVIFIPIYRPVTFSYFNKKLTSIFDDRPISSSYYNRKHDDIHCFIPGMDETKKDPFTVEQFRLTVRHNRSKLNKEHMHQYELQCARGGNVYRTFTEIRKDWLHLHPHGAMVALLKARKAIGILNFTEDGRISPTFFTPETLTG